MLKARDIMTPDPVTLAPDTDIRTAVMLLIEKKINGAPVVDATGKVVGVLCQSDLVAQQKRVTMPSLLAVLDGFIALSSREDFEREIKKIAASKTNIMKIDATFSLSSFCRVFSSSGGLVLSRSASHGTCEISTDIFCAPSGIPATLRMLRSSARSSSPESSFMLAILTFGPLV